MRTILNCAILMFSAGLVGLSAQGLVIPQVADGANWKTTVVITNTTASTAAATLTFNMDTVAGATAAWTPTFLEGNNTTGLSLPAGSSTYLHTPGTAAALTQGWAQLSAPSGVEAYVVYTFTQPATGKASDATAQAGASATRILMPFDNTNGLVTAMAIVNPNAAAENISVNFRTSSGVTTGSLGSLPAMGQLAFVVPTQFADLENRAGLAEFYSTGTFSIIALRANPSGGFTSAPVYFESGPPILQQSGGGDGAGVTYGGFALSEQNQVASTSTLTEGAAGGFSSYTSTAWNTPVTTVSPCSITKLDWSLTGTDPLLPMTLLDAGEIDISGPNVPSTPLTKTTTPIGPSYGLQFSNGTLKDGGSYTLTGKGGTQVGAFTVSGTMPTNFKVTNLSSIATINRSQPLTVNWTGTGFADVDVVASSLVTGVSGIESVTVSCIVPASAGTFAIPTAALAYLDPVSSGALLSTGLLKVSTVENAPTGATAVGSNVKQLTPPLVGGGSIDYGEFLPVVSYSKSVLID